MSRKAEGSLRLVPVGGRTYRCDVRPRASAGVVELELHRDDSKPSPVVRLALDDARALLRLLQAACDRAHHQAKLEHHRRIANAEIDRILDRVEGADFQ